MLKKPLSLHRIVQTTLVRAEQSVPAEAVDHDHQLHRPHGDGKLLWRQEDQPGRSDPGPAAGSALRPPGLPLRPCSPDHHLHPQSLPGSLKDSPLTAHPRQPYPGAGTQLPGEKKKFKLLPLMLRD